MPLKHQFEQDGYIVLRDFFSPNELLLLTELVDPVYEQWLAQNTDNLEQYGLINMHSLTQSDYFKDAPERRVEMFNAISPNKLVELLDEVFEREIHFHNTQLFFNPVNSEQLPYWHRDLQFSPIPEADQRAQQGSLLSLHVRIPLVKEVGLELVPGTNQRWDTELENNVRLEKNGHKNSDPLPDAVVLDLEPGDLVIFDAMMIHRGKYSDNDVRKALDLCVGAEHDLLKGTLDPSNLPTDAELKLLQTDTWYRRSKEVVNHSH